MYERRNGTTVPHKIYRFATTPLFQIMSSEVERSIKDLTLSYKRDHCALVRSACAFIVHVSQDEHRLFYQFFNNASSQLV